jgi:hypothetical protein
VTGAAVVQRILDSIRVGFGFVEVRSEAGIECGADLRNLWLSDGACVLRASGGRGEKQEPQQKRAPFPSFPRRGGAQRRGG